MRRKTMNRWFVDFIKGKEERRPLYIIVEAPDAVTAIQEAARIVRDEYGWGASVFFTDIGLRDFIEDDEIGVVKEDPIMEPGDYKGVKW